MIGRSGIRHGGLDIMNRCGKGPQLDLVGILDNPWATLLPLKRGLDILGSVNQHIEGAGPLQQRQKGDASSNLTNDGLNLLDYFHFILFRLRRLCWIKRIGMLFDIDVKGPTFYNLFSSDRGDDDDDTMKGVPGEPELHLRKNRVQVGFDTGIGGKHHGKAVLGNAGKGLGRVNAALVEQGVDAIGEKVSNEVGGAGQSDGVIGSWGHDGLCGLWGSELDGEMMEVEGRMR